MAQFLDTSITGSLILSGSLTPITFPGTNTRIEVGDPNGTDYSLNFRSNRYYYFQDNATFYVQGSITARNGIRNDGGPLGLGHLSANIMYLSGSSVGIGTSTPSRKLSVEGNAYVKGQFAVDVDNPGTNLREDSQIKLQSRGNQAGTIRSSQWYLETDSDSIYGNSAFTIAKNYDGGSQSEYLRISSAGDVTIKQDLTVEGIVTAQEFHTEFVSASIIYSSGSTKFGDTVDDDHNFTGSINLLAQSGASGLDIKRGSNIYMNLNNSSTRNEFNFKSSTGLRFYHGTDSTTPLFISSSGNVGIGTTNPLYKLHVVGEGLFQSDIIISGSSPAIKFNEVGQATNEAYLGIGGQKMTIYTGRTGTSRNDLWLRVGDSANSSTPTIFATGSNGYVGIGNEAPARRLHIGGTGGSGGGIMLSPSSGDIEIQFQDSGTTNAYITLKDGTQQMRLRDDSANVLNIDFGTERVGILTTAPTVALQVEGDVSASGYLKGDTLYALNDVVVADQILHYGDTDTNISFTDDQIVLNAGNVEFIRLSEGLSDQLVINEGGAALDLRVEGDADTNLIRTDAANDRVGIGTSTPQRKLDVKLPNTSGDLASIAGQLSVGVYQGLHFGYSEPNNNLYRKSAIVFERTDYTSNNAQGKVHILNGPQAGSGNATLADAKLTIGESGNVGIGVTSPSHSLHVSGTYDVVKIEGSGSANSSSLFEVHGNNGLLFAIDDDLSDSLFSVNTIAGLPVIEAFSDNRVVMGAYNQNDFVISGSKVGIGTESAAGKLHVYTGDAGATTTNSNHDDLIIEGSGNIGMQLFSPASSYQYIAFGDPGAANAGYIRYYHTNNEMVFRTNGGDRMTITSGGNVAIGSTSAYTVGGTAKLTIAGNSAIWGASNTDMSYFRRLGAGTFQWQTYNGGNSGDINLQPYGGSVGIGTTAPASKLEVRDGNIVVSGSTSKVALGTATGVPRMNSNSSNDLLFSTATQTNALYIQEANGRVGVGTTSPTKALTIEGDVSASGGFYGDGSNLTGITVSSTLNDILANGNEATSYNIDMNNNDIIGVDEVTANIFNGASASLSYITASADLFIDTNVGIGTASPQKPLHVSSNNDAPIRVESTDATTGILFVDPNGSNALYYVGSGDSFYTSAKLGIGQAPSRDLHVKKANSGGQVRLEVFNSSNTANSHGIVSIYSGGASGGDPFLHWKIDVQQDWSMGIDNSDGDKLKISKNFGPGTNDYLTVDTAGNVGIGTTTPSDKLDVHGVIALNSVAFISQSGNVGYIGDIDGVDDIGNIDINTAGGSTRIFLEDSGKVGINTETPSTALHISGGSNFRTLQLEHENPGIYFKDRGYTQGYHIGYNADELYILRDSDGDGDYNNILASWTGTRYRVWGDQQIDGDLTVSGIVTAQEFHTEFVSASIVYQSGSTKFGNTLDDNHSFTGSLEVSGSSNFSTHIGNPSSPYGGDDQFIRLISPNGTTGTLVNADNGNTWLNADGGKDLWLNWYSLNSPTSNADLQVGDGEGGSAILTVAGSSRRVGINQTSPSAELTVQGSIHISSSLPQLRFSDLQQEDWQISNDNGDFRFTQLDDNITAMYISSSGNVGIGTTTPTRTLDVAGTVAGTDFYVDEYIFHNDDINTYMRFLGDHIQFNAGGLQMITINENGTQDKVVINEDSNDVDFRVEGNGDANLLFTDAGNDRVGIGTSTPSTKLTVAGAISASSHVYAETYRSSRTDGDLYLQATTSGDFVALGTQDNVDIVKVNGDGSVQFTEYGSGTNTGTAAYNLQVDSSGNIIEQALGGTVANATSASYAEQSREIFVDNTDLNTTLYLLGTGGNSNGYKSIYKDDSDAVYFNPNTGIVTATGFSGNLSGTATNADNINVDEKNDNVNYQVLFSAANGSGYQRPYIDTDNAHLTYNPSTHTLTAGTFSGALSGNASTATSATSASYATNADTLDGVSSTSFLRSDIADTATQLTVNTLIVGSAAKIRFANNDYIRYDDTANRFHFDADGGTSNASIQASTFVGALSGNASTATTASYVAGGNVDGAVESATNATNATNFNVAADNSTDADHYLIFTGGATGNQRPNSDTGLLYNPGTNILTVGILEAGEKSFNIPHPTKEGKRLIYGVLEGPEHGVYVRGKSTSKVIELPEVWTGLVHEDSITVQLTCKGKPFNIWVEDIRDNKVYINTDVDEFEFFYYIQGERKDVDKLIIERDAD